MSEHERERLTTMSEHENLFDTFKPGDPVNWSAGTDVEAGTVTRVTAATVFVRPVKALLLNGTHSGEPDALTFSPGGFCGHMSGTQRYRFEEIPDAKEVKFTLRQSGRAKMSGASSRGSMRSWGLLRHGHAAHYDFNF